MLDSIGEFLRADVEQPTTSLVHKYAARAAHHLAVNQRKRYHRAIQLARAPHLPQAHSTATSSVAVPTGTAAYLRAKIP